MKSALSGILATLLMVVTVGIPIFRHTCNFTKRSEVSILAKDQCCNPSTDSSETTLDFQCCSLEQFDTVLDYETLVKEKFESRIELSIVELLVINEVGMLLFEIENEPVLRPPPPANRDLLNKIQLYRI